MAITEVDVIVVGGGPVGLLAACRLAKAGISVIVLEALAELENSPRAAVYRGPALLELVAAGIMDDVKQRGIKTTDISWRRADGSLIAMADSQTFFPEGHPNECYTLGQYGLSKIITEHVGNLDNCKIMFSNPVCAIDQDSTSVTVTTDTPQGKKQYKAKYMIGSDGGRSVTRKLLGVKMEGYTFPYPVIANNVYYPFEKHGFNNGQYFVDPDHWALIARLDDEGLWRVSYGEKEGLTEEQLTDPERVKAKFEVLFPGPRPLDYKIVSTRAYYMHQRCADKFRIGRCLLAGDAARLNNPFGGLGLTGGILDAGAAAESLIAVLQDGEPDSILDKYAQIRRDIFLKYNNEWSIANVKLLYETDPKTAHEHPVMKAINETSPEEARASFCDDHIIRHSMIREYSQPDKKKLRQDQYDVIFKDYVVVEK